MIVMPQDDETQRAWYKPNPTGLPTTISNKNQLIHDKLTSAHIHPNIQTLLYRANDHIHILQHHNTVLYTDQHRLHPSTTIHTLTRTAHARRHPNHACKA